MIKSSDIRQKEVINVIDGKRLGNIIDMEFDLEQGRIKSITVPGPAKFFNIFKNEKDYVIPWNKIKKIGDDVILVELENTFFNQKNDKLD